MEKKFSRLLTVNIVIEITFQSVFQFFNCIHFMALLFSRTLNKLVLTEWKKLWIYCLRSITFSQFNGETGSGVNYIFSLYKISIQGASIKGEGLWSDRKRTSIVIYWPHSYVKMYTRRERGEWHIWLIWAYVRMSWIAPLYIFQKLKKLCFQKFSTLISDPLVSDI